jgi:signal transduction histidine kinase
MPFSLVMSALPIAIAFSIMRHRLWNIDLLINRTLVYGALTAFIVALYVLVVGGLGALFQSSGNFFFSLLATGVIALLVNPLRLRLQRFVNRLMYGERDDPYKVLSQLSQHLEATQTPDSILSTIVETIAQTLKLPYAAILLADGKTLQTAAEAGSPTDHFLTLTLTHQHQTIGELRVAQRSGNEPFTPAERRLLEDIAAQTGVAVHNVRLTADLQASREHLVMAREEERRRIRRDLHDGLGPTLASLTLKLDAARNQLKQNPRQADSLLVELKSQTQAAIEDIRRLVYNLRPPALDELGLFSAIREYATNRIRAGLSVRVEEGGEIPKLPAAVEVAAYRIVCEALTNASKHSQAAECIVQLTFDGGLQIDILDNGVGLPAGAHSGVGMFSMRERAAELGGTFAVQSKPGSGVHITAHLPCEVSSDEH